METQTTEEEPRCIGFECYNVVPDEGERCHECAAYLLELAADCARTYYDRPSPPNYRQDMIEAGRAHLLREGD